MKKNVKSIKEYKNDNIYIQYRNGDVGADDPVRLQSNRNTQNGITLVALVITIIVLLLLAVVSINIVQNSGLIEKTKLAKEEHRASAIQEQLDLLKNEQEIAKQNNETEPSINELIDKLQEQKLITSEEKSTIMQTGKIKLGSKNIIFDKNKVIPDNYKRCEYLESTGTQYIDTEVLPSNNTGIDIRFRVLQYENKEIPDQYTCFIFGGESAWQGSSFDFQAGKYGLVYNKTKVGTEYNTETLSDFNKDVHDLKIINQQYYFDNNFQYDLLNINTNEWNANSSIILFGIKRNNNIQRLDSAKIYCCKLYNGENLERNLIPCLDSNNRPCMYDTVSGQTFYNQGTGEFIAGPALT